MQGSDFQVNTNEELYLSSNTFQQIEETLIHLPIWMRKRLSGFSEHSSRFDNEEDYREYVGNENIATKAPVDLKEVRVPEDKWKKSPRYLLESFLGAIFIHKRQGSGCILVYENLAEQDALRIYDAFSFLRCNSLIYKITKLVAFPRHNLLIIKTKSESFKAWFPSFEERQEKRLKLMCKLNKEGWAHADSCYAIDYKRGGIVGYPEAMFKIDLNTTPDVEPEQWLLDWMKEGHDLDSGNRVDDVNMLILSTFEEPLDYPPP